MNIYGYDLDEYADFARDMYECEHNDCIECSTNKKKLEVIEENFINLESILKSPLALDMEGLYKAIDAITHELQIGSDDYTIKIARAIFPRPEKYPFPTRSELKAVK